MKSAISHFLAISFLCAAMPAMAQVTQVQQGQALDANPQIGSGGYNTVTGGVGGVNSQLYINGQVTGLNYFHGRVGYSAPNELSPGVAVTPFNNFRRSSVGLRDVLAGPAYTPAPYYNSDRSVAQYGNVPQGGTVPNARVFNIGSIGDSLAQKLYVDATADYKPLTPLITQDTGGVPANRNAILAITGGGALPPPNVNAAGAAGIAAPGDVFDTLRPQDRQELVRQLMQAPGEDEEDQAAEGRVDQRVKPEVEARLKREIKRQVKPQDNANPPAVAPGAPGEQEPSAASPEGITRGGFKRPAAGGEDVANRSRARGAENLANPQSLDDTQRGPAGPVGQTLRVGRQDFTAPPPDQDIYMDMLVRLHQQRMARAANPSLAADDAQSLENAYDPSAQPTPNAAGGMTGPRVELSRQGVVVIHRLAGSSDDVFNKYMAEAEKKLLAGRYYDARRDYESASLVNSANPLAYLGMTLASFGAGEAYFASLQLRKAVEAFPPVMETRMDVRNLIKSDVLNPRIDTLSQRIDAEPTEANLIFLAAFLHRNLGDAAKARHYARLLEISKTPDPLFQAYAQFILTGKRPGQSATSNPATHP